MGDTVYRVVLDLSTRGSFSTELGKIGGLAAKVDGHFGDARKHIEHMAHSIERVGHVTERVGHGIEHIADMALHAATSFAKWSAVGISGLGVYGVAHLNSELEQTQVSLAAIAQAQGFTRTFSGGMALAADQLAKMKKDVMTLPGDLGQLSSLMKVMATPAAAGGLSMDQIRKMAGRTMLTAGILSVPIEFAGREMAGLMTGRAGSHNMFGARLGLLGEEAKKFNALSPAARMERLNKELDKYKDSADRFGQTWVAQWTTLKDNIKYTFLATATAPLFESAKKTLGEINEWFEHHQDTVKAWALEFGSHFRETWTLIVGEAKQFGPALANIGHVFFALWDRALAKFKEFAPLLLAVAHRLEELNPGTVATGVEMAIGGKLGGMGLGLVGQGIGGAATIYRALAMAKLSRQVAALAAGGAGAGEGAALAGGGAAAAGGAGLLSLGTLGLWGGAALLGGGLGYGAAKLSDASERNRRAASDAQARWEWQQAGGSLDFPKVGEKMSEFTKPMDDVMRKYQQHIDTMTEMDVEMQRFAYFMHLAQSPVGSAEWHPGTYGGDVRDDDRFQQLLDADAKRKKMAGGAGGTTIGKVEIVVNSNQDPSRVARLTLDEIEKLERRRSRHVPNYATANR